MQSKARLAPLQSAASEETLLWRRLRASAAVPGARCGPARLRQPRLVGPVGSEWVQAAVAAGAVSARNFTRDFSGHTPALRDLATGTFDAGPTAEWTT